MSVGEGGLSHGGPALMQDMLGQVVFAVGREQYRWADVVLAARLWGDWADLEAEARELAACAKQSQVTGEHPAPEAVSSAAATFRYERDLITAQETEAWLTDWGLTPQAWMDYIKLCVLRRQWSGRTADLIARYPASDEEMEPILRTAGICSGYMQRFARRLAGRAAVHASLAAKGEVPADALETPPEWGVTLAPWQALSRVPCLPCQALPGFTPERCQEATEAIARLEVSFGRFRERVLTRKAITECIGAHQLDWIRLRCQSLACDTETTAREAALCLREDRRELHEVATESKATCRTVRFSLHQIQDVTLRDRFLCARSGELLGPLKVDGAFVLILVDEKVMPSEHDPEVRRLAEESVLDAAVASEVHHRVRWLAARCSHARIGERRA